MIGTLVLGMGIGVFLGLGVGVVLLKLLVAPQPQPARVSQFECTRCHAKVHEGERKQHLIKSHNAPGDIDFDAYFEPVR